MNAVKPSLSPTLEAPRAPRPHLPRTPAWLRPVLVVVLLELALVSGGLLLLPVHEWVLQQAIPITYFEPELDRPDELEQIRGPIFAFRHGINRSVIVDTGAELAVFDTFNKTHAERLRRELEVRFPGHEVRWVFYSHSHLDHIGGAAALHPKEVLAHRGVMPHVADWPNADVLPVTRTLEGDADLMLGSVHVRLLHLGESHTDSLYAFHFPEQRTVFAPDTAFIHTAPPFGVPDHYYPGYIRALDRIAAIDFDVCLPAHFGWGNKSEFLEFRQMMIDYRAAAAALVADMGGDPSRGAGQRARIGAAYRELKVKYGSYHGFDAMFIPHFLGGIGGTYLGY